MDNFISHLFHPFSVPEPHVSTPELMPTTGSGNMDGSYVNHPHLGETSASTYNSHGGFHAATLPGLYDGTTFLSGPHVSATLAPTQEQPVFSGSSYLEPTVSHPAHNAHDMNASPGNHLIHNGTSHDPVFGRYQAGANDDFLGRPQGHSHAVHTRSWESPIFAGSQTTPVLADEVTPHSSSQLGSPVASPSPENNTAVQGSHLDTKTHGKPVFGYIHEGIHDCTYSNGKVYGPGGHVIDTY